MSKFFKKMTAGAEKMMAGAENLAAHAAAGALKPLEITWLDEIVNNLLGDYDNFVNGTLMTIASIFFDLEINTNKSNFNFSLL